MKLKKVVLMLLAVGLVFSGIGMAASSDPVIMTGMLQANDNGIVLVTENETYTVTGEALDGMVGKTVEITGVVQESDSGKILQVLSIKEAVPAE